MISSQAARREPSGYPALEAENLSVRFGGLNALQGFSFQLGYQQIGGLIGPNGAGKTTCFNLLTNLYEPTEGNIKLFGHEIKGAPSYHLFRWGLGRTFQNIRLFHRMTVLENVMVTQPNSSFFRANHQHRKDALELLDFFHLADQAEKKAGSLPYGAQRRLEIARALAGNPGVLLLDEPAAGMNPSETYQLAEQIKEIRNRFQVSILLIEHDMHLVMGVCDYLWVLNFGQQIAQGTPMEIQRNPAVIEAYLGRKERSEC